MRMRIKPTSEKRSAKRNSRSGRRHLIDLWDTGTYHSDIQDHLDSYKEVITGYLDLEQKKDAMVAILATWEPIRPNPFTGDYMSAVESLGPIMAAKTVRAFHYSRMTDDEVEALRAEGIVPTAVSSLEQRVNRQVISGTLTREQGDLIIERGSLQAAAFGIRKGFWSSSSPIHPDDAAVNLLVDHWGGESARWLFTGTEDEQMIEVLKGIGRGRVIEVAISLKDANGGLAGFSAARTSVREYARSLGHQVYPEALDLAIEHPLPASRILKVHTEGEDGYQTMGIGYPSTFIAPDSG